MHPVPQRIRDRVLPCALDRLEVSPADLLRDAVHSNQ